MPSTWLDPPNVYWMNAQINVFFKSLFTLCNLKYHRQYKECLPLSPLPKTLLLEIKHFHSLNHHLSMNRPQSLPTAQTWTLNTAEISSPEYSHSFFDSYWNFQPQYPSNILNLTLQNQISHSLTLQKQLILLNSVFLLKAPLIYQSPKSKRNFTAFFLSCFQAHLKSESHQSASPVDSSYTRCFPSVSRL